LLALLEEVKCHSLIDVNNIDPDTGIFLVQYERYNWIDASTHRESMSIQLNRMALSEFHKELERAAC
jgi:hypothetical protein